VGELEVSRGIPLSPKHGVNPAIPLCFFCNEPKNEIILAGRLKDDAEAPQHVVWNYDPCDKCKGYMQAGVICISVRDGESGDNPYRTGGWVVLKDEAVARIITTADVRDYILKKRIAFVPDNVWDAIGLPRGEVKP
jgi:hypothetical protein